MPASLGNRKCLAIYQDLKEKIKSKKVRFRVSLTALLASIIYYYDIYSTDF